MTIDFRAADFDDLSEIYNRAAPERYQIDARLLEQHTIGCPAFDWGASLIEPGKAFVSVKRSADRLYRGPNSDTFHLSAVGFQDPTVLLDLLKVSKHYLIERGAAKLQFGADSGHLFPGCPIDWSSLKDFLLIGGFEVSGEAHDLERDLTDYEMPRPLPAGFEFRAVGNDDLPSLERFLVAEFPGRWHYDTFRKIEQEGDPGVVFGLFDGSKCKGFALTQWDGSMTQIGGAVWRIDLGEAWCSLGPIGVAKSVRGKGCGHGLLGAALASLRDRGCKRCIIDWTGLVDFYGAHGFVVTRTYQYCSLDLERMRNA